MICLHLSGSPSTTGAGTTTAQPDVGTGAEETRTVPTGTDGMGAGKFVYSEVFSFESRAWSRLSNLVMHFHPAPCCERTVSTKCARCCSFASSFVCVSWQCGIVSDW